MQRTARMKREQDMMFRSPPFGISCWPVGDSLEHLEAQIIGNKDTPYADGVFKLDIAVPERYPFEPPKIRFITSIYHPNIDSAGRICLDILKMPPAGNWKPSLNISTVLTSIQLLMNEPNPDDPLMTDISNEYKYNKAEYIKHAQDWTRKHAIQKTPQQDKEVLASKYNDVSDDSDDLSDETSEEEDVEDHKPGFRKRTLPKGIKVPVSKHLRT